MGENVYKMRRFLGKFKKGPPHIGEYEKKWHFRGGQSIVRYNDKSNTLNLRIQNTYKRQFTILKAIYHFKGNLPF